MNGNRPENVMGGASGIRRRLPVRKGLTVFLRFPCPPAELLAEFANYFHYGYHECMKNLVHYLTTVERMETKDTK